MHTADWAESNLFLCSNWNIEDSTLQRRPQHCKRHEGKTYRTVIGACVKCAKQDH